MHSVTSTKVSDGEHLDDISTSDTLVCLCLALNRETGEEVAVKFEPARTKFPQLYYEAKLYKVFDGSVGLP